MNRKLEKTRKLKPYASTNANLLAHGLAPTLRWLISIALDGTTITYGELARKLENEAGFSTIFTTRIGFVVGSLMERIQNVAPNTPLINVIVVNQQDRLPSRGAGGFMALRFREERLAHHTAKELYPRLWEQNFKKAAGEVYMVSQQEWCHVYFQLFGKALEENTIKNDRLNRKNGSEKDGIQLGRRYGANGEGPFHKALRIWVKENPGQVHSSFSDATAETEVDLDSGDRVDVVFKLPDRTVVVEVKSRISDEIDMRRGVYQCVKYRAVRQAMDVRNNTPVEAILVTENELSGEIKALIKLHGLSHFQADISKF